MSEFLMVVPPGWMEANLDPILATVSEQDLIYYAANEPATVDMWLEDTGQLPAGTTVAEARVFKDGDALRLWYRVVAV